MRLNGGLRAGILTPAVLLAAFGGSADRDLLAALKTGDQEVVQAALRAGADPNATDVNRCSAVFWAASSGRIELIQPLLELGADVNRSCEDGQTPLWAAAGNGHVGAVTRLLEAGVSLDIEADDFERRVRLIGARGFTQTAVVLTAAYGSGKAAWEGKFEAKPYPDFVTRFGRTALLDASGKGNTARVVALLERGASVNSVAPGGENPLSVAVRGKHREVVKLLLARSPEPRTALRAQQAAGNNKEMAGLVEPAVRLGDRIVGLAREGATGETLRFAARTGTLDWVDRDGQTPLGAAAAAGRLATVEAILGGDVDLQGPSIRRAMAAAAENGHTQVATLLKARIDLAADRIPLTSVLPEIRDFRSLWRLKPGWRALLSAVDAELQPYRSHVGEKERGAAQRATAAASGLRAQAERFWKLSGPPVPRSYLASLAADLWTLRTVDSSTDITALLNGVAEDLEDKLAHCRSSGTGLGGKVQLLVRTMKGGEEARNWRVFYLPKMMDGLTEGEPFPVYSSPTAFSLSPGRYIIWAKDPSSGVEGERSVVRLGGGRTSEVVQIPVP